MTMKYLDRKVTCGHYHFVDELRLNEEAENCQLVQTNLQLIKDHYLQISKNIFESEIVAATVFLLFSYMFTLFQSITHRTRYFLNLNVYCCKRYTWTVMKKHFQKD